MLRRNPCRTYWWMLIAGAPLIAGCGGGMRQAATPSTKTLTVAKFDVNAATGKVHISEVPQSGGRAIFAGGTVTFSSSDLLSTGGDSGQRLIHVTVHDNSNQPIMTDSGGLRSGQLIVSNLTTTNATTPGDIRGDATVSTFSGSASGTGGSTDGSATTAKFGLPSGVAAAPSGALALAIGDRNNDTIRIVQEDGSVTTLAGVAGAMGSADGAGSAARFSLPGQVAYDSKGNLYVAEEANNKIRRITPNGDVRTIAGTGAAGSADGDGSTATFRGPVGIAVSSDGTRIYVSDTGNNTIRLLYYSGGSPDQRTSYQVSTIAGLAGSAALTDGLGANARFRQPYHIALTPENSVPNTDVLYVADRGNNAVRRVTIPIYGGDIDVMTIAGTGAAGSADGPGATATLNSPAGISAPRIDTVYFTELYGDTVRVIKAGETKNASVVATLAGLAKTAGSTDGSGTDARFNTPLGICALDTSGNGFTAYVADAGNHNIRKITGSIPVLSGGGGSTVTEPVRMVNYDTEVPNQTAWAMDVQWPYNTGTGTPDPAADLQFYVPNGVSGFSFTLVLQMDTDMVNLPAAGASYVSTLAGTGLPGATNGPGKLAQFAQPVGVVAVPSFLSMAYSNALTGLGAPSSVSSSDLLVRAFVSDFGNNRIRFVMPDGMVGTFAGGVQGYADGKGTSAMFKYPRGIGIAPDGSIYVADTGNFRIRRIFPDSTVVTVAGTGATGAADGPGNTATISTVEGLTVDQGGTVWMTDLVANVVRRLDYVGGDPKLASSYTLTTVAGTPGATGSADATGSAAQFNQPYGIAADNNGVVYVADQGNNTIRKLTPTAGGMAVTTLAGLAGSSGTADGIGSAARFNGPLGLALDSAHNLYETDRNTSRLRRISPTGTVVTLAGSTPGFADGPAGTFNLPRLISLEGSGNVLVADFNNNALRVVQRVVSDAQLP